MCTSPGTGTPRRAAGSPSCGSSTSVTPRTPWTLWTARCSTGGSFGCRWPGTGDPRTPCTAGEVLRRADTEEGTVAAGAGAAQQVPVAADVAEAAPGAEAVPDPGAATTTAAPGLAPTPDPGRGPGPSLNPSPNPSPGPPDGARQSLPPGLGPPSQGVEPRLPTEGPNPGLAPNPRVGLNLQRTTKQRLNPDLDTT